MPITPFFDPATGASGGPQASGGGGLVYETLADVNFKAQGTQVLANGTAFTLVDSSGRTISGTSFATYTNEPSVSSGWDAARGYYVEIGNTATNTVAKMAVPIAFGAGVSVGFDDDLEFTITGVMNLPQTNHRQYWMIGIPSTILGWEVSGTQGASMLRLNSTTSNLTFNFNGGQTQSFNNTSPVNPGTTLDMINGTQTCTLRYFQPRRATRGDCQFTQVNIARSLLAYGGHDAQTGVNTAPQVQTGYNAVPYPWLGKTAFNVNQVIQNGAVNGLGLQFTQIHRVVCRRRTIQ